MIRKMLVWEGKKRSITWRGVTGGIDKGHGLITKADGILGGSSIRHQDARVRGPGTGQRVGRRAGEARRVESNDGPGGRLTWRREGRRGCRGHGEGEGKVVAEKGLGGLVLFSFWLRSS